MRSIFVSSQLLNGVSQIFNNHCEKSFNPLKSLTSLKLISLRFQSQINFGFREMAMERKGPLNFSRIDERLVWVDLEMTGLNIEKERIMEAAVIVTDSNLDIIKEGPNIVIKVEDDILNNMNEWCQKHHGESGLTEACRKSDTTLSMAEDKILEFIVQHTEPGRAPLAGNSVHADKKFLDKYMPKLMKHLHYRIVDVSTIKELCRRWYPDEFNAAPKKQLCHRALDDIKESIEELKYYKSSVFK